MFFFGLAALYIGRKTNPIIKPPTVKVYVKGDQRSCSAISGEGVLRSKPFPQRLFHSCLNFSLSSGDIFLHACPRPSLLAWNRGPPRKPPNNILDNNNNPRACQKLMRGKWNNTGNKAFHNNMTMFPKMNTPAMASRIKPAILRNLKWLILFILMIDNFVIQCLKPVAQIQYCVSFTRNKGVDLLAGELGNLFKRHISQLIPHKYGPLLFG